MFDVGVPELVLILVVALVVFGPGKLPEIGAQLGKTIREFRRATQSVTDEFNSVTKLETEDEMRTRLIMENNRKQAAAASITITDPMALSEPATQAASESTPAINPTAEAVAPATLES
jgi:sec-independent protein translocase protein TatA